MKQAQHLDYRADIDGLRSIAVLLVVFFHAGYSLVSGGFVGVDVFFVISGFLITGVIVKNFDRDAFSYKNFYLSRIRRLAPAFVFVLATSLVLGYKFLLPEDFVSHVKLMGLSLISLGNFYIANTTDGYFAATVESIPLIHTWSLAVEEQFYFLWPALLVFLLKVFNKRQLAILLPIGVVGTLIFSEWYAYNQAIRAYYLLPARIFELLLGASLVFLPRSPLADNRVVSTLASAVGVVLIVASALILSKDSVFPGFNAFWPCLGTALIMYMGSRDNGVSRLLSLPAFVWVGKLSYSLYLWHWVIFTFYRYVYGELIGGERIFCIALAILLSQITWMFVENPFRYKFRMRFAYSAASLIGLPMLVFTLVYFYVDQHEGVPERFGASSLAMVTRGKQPTDLKMHCDNKDAGLCGDILIVGDSHGIHFGEFLNVLAKDQGLTIFNMSRAGCTPLYDISLVTKKSSGLLLYDQFDCRTHNNTVLDHLSGQKYVVLAGYWELTHLSEGRYYWVQGPEDELSEKRSRQSLEDGLTRSLQKIVDAGATPVLMVDNLTVPEATYKCAVRKLIFDYHSDCSRPASELQEQQENSRALFARLNAKFPEMVVIDPNKILCDAEKCHTIFEELPLYGDKNHLHWYVSRLVGRRYLELFGNPLSPSSSALATGEEKSLQEKPIATM